MNFRILLAVTIVPLFLLASCKQDAAGSKAQSEQTVSGQPAPETTSESNTFNRYFEDEDALVTFFVQAENAEVTKPRILTKGLENEFDQTFTIEGQLTDGHLLDLDGDGFNELYLVYRLTDDSGNLDMIAIRSNSYLDASVVGVQKIKERRKVNTDRIYAINGKLRRSFTDQDGNTVNYTYQLVRGSQGGWYLLPVKG